MLEELERAIAALSPGLADAGLAGYDEGVVDELVRAAAEQWRNRHGATGGHEAKAADPAAIRSLRAALQVLARVLEGRGLSDFRPPVYRSRAATTSLTSMAPTLPVRVQASSIVVNANTRAT